jgi:hypothetical protein
MASAFLELGASAYVGYTEIVSTSFANDHGISLFTYLTAEEGNRLLSVPGLNVDIDPNSYHARFVMFGDYEVSLRVNDLLEETVLYLSYTLPPAGETLRTSELSRTGDHFHRSKTHRSG